MNRDIENRLAALNARIADCARRVGRQADEITLMPVTKTVPAEAIRRAVSAGYPLIGENKVQEIRAKAPALADIAHQTHLIGHLQTNKVKDIIGHVHCVQSLDSIKLAAKLQARLEQCAQTLDVLIQVNTSGEASKSGVAPQAALSLIGEVLAYDRLRIRGLMTIGANSDDHDAVRACFRLLAQIREQARQRYGDRADFSTLSMGMSADMEIAIEEGATLLRVGSAIFGARNNAGA